MTRLKQLPRTEIHAGAEPYFEMLFGDRDPVTEPGTGTGTPGNWWTVFAAVPDIFDHAIAGFTLYQDAARQLDPALRELAQTRAGYACGSRFVFSQHSKGCRDAGIDEDKIRAIPGWQVAANFTPIERAVLAYTDGLALEHGRVADAVFDVLQRHLSETAILELTYVIATYVMHAGISRALRLEYDDVEEPVREVPAPSGETGLLATFNMPPDSIDS
jgi:alkylhydroperoxidase family enzyme